MIWLLFEFIGIEDYTLYSYSTVLMKVLTLRDISFCLESISFLQELLGARTVRRALSANTLSRDVRLSSQASIIEVGIATARPTAVVNRATHIPPAKSDGSTEEPPACSPWKASIIPKTNKLSNLG